MRESEHYTIAYGQKNMRATLSGVTKIIRTLARQYGLSAISISYRVSPKDAPVDIIRDGKLGEEVPRNAD